MIKIKNLVKTFDGFTALDKRQKGYRLTAYFIAQMIAEKRLNVLDKRRDLIKFGSVAAGLFIIISAIFWLDLFGYQKYSPDPQDVEGVYFNYPWLYMGQNTTPLIKERFFISDAEIISEAINIHREIVSNKKELRDVYDIISGSYNEKYGLIKSQTFVFKMKGGRIVSRQYSLPLAFMEESGLNSLLVNETVLSSAYQSFKTPEYVNKLNLSYNKTGDPNEQAILICIENPEHINSVLEVIKKDLVISSKAEQKAEIENAGRNYYYNNMAWPKEKIYVRADYYIDSYEGFFSCDYFHLGEGENTLAWLLKEGYME